MTPIVYHHQVRSGSEPGHGVGVVVEAEVLGQVDREGERLLSQDARLGLGWSGDGDNDDKDINDDGSDDVGDNDNDEKMKSTMMANALSVSMECFTFLWFLLNFVQAILLLKTLIPRKGELLRSSSSVKQGKDYLETLSPQPL